MATYTEDLEKIKQLRKTQSAASQQAGQLGASAQGFNSRVMQKVRDARAARGVSQLNVDIGSITGRMVTEPAEIRGRLEGVNPLAVDAVTAAQRGQQLGTLGTLANYQADISGTIGDVIGQGTDRLKTMAALKQAEAQQAATEAANLMEQVKWKAAQEQQAFENMMAQKNYELARQRLARSGSSGPGIEDYLDMALKWKNLTGGEDVPKEAISEAQDYRTLLNDLKSIRSGLVEQAGEKPGYGSLLKTVTGPLASLFGGLQSGPSEAVRRDLDRLRSQVQHEYYGSALTKQEKEQAEKWLPKAGMQEQKNINRLDSLIKQKENELQTRLDAYLSPGDINSFVQSGQLPQMNQGQNPFLQFLNLGGQFGTPSGAWVVEEKLEE